MATLTENAGSGAGAGPRRTLPVVAAYREPWQGQSSRSPAGATVQPLCVQMALKATAVVLVGRATISGCPLGPFAATADPTGMSASFTSGRVDAAEGLAVSVGALVGDDDVVDCAGWELGLDELEHPVTTSAPAAVPPTSTARRLTDFATMPPDVNRLRGGARAATAIGSARGGRCSA